MPIVTFTSDVGLRDHSVGAIKGCVLQHNPGANLIDITHMLSPFNFPQAAYVIQNAIKHYPSGSIHIVMVNLFDTKPERILLVEHQSQFIFCADNGLITMTLEGMPEKTIGITLDKSKPRHILSIADTIGKAIKRLSDGASADELGTADVEIVRKNPLKPTLGTDWMEGQIILIDDFENVVVNITKEEFEAQRKGRRFVISFKRDETIDRISESYADVAEGEKLALFNSSGYLEIAMNKGNAAGLFGLQGFSERQASQGLTFYHTVKIFFV